MPATAPCLSRRALVRLLAAAGPAAFAAAALTGCTKDAAPDTRFLLLDGSALSAASLRGKVYLLNFWATSCTTCVAEMPQIAATYQRYRDRGYDTVAVAMQYDPPAYVARFAQTRALPFKVAVDHDGQVARAWGDVRITPTSYLVDRQGRIVKRYVGQPDFAALHVLVERLLAEG